MAFQITQDGVLTDSPEERFRRDRALMGSGQGLAPQPPGPPQGMPLPPSMMPPSPPVAQPGNDPVTAAMLNIFQRPTQPQGPPPIPANPDTRASLWRNLLSDFVWSLGSSMSASAKAPPGQRQVAGFGAALEAPFQRRAQEQQLQFAGEKAAAAQQSAEARATSAEATMQKLMAMIPVLQSTANKNNSQAEYNNERGETVQIDSGEKDANGQPIMITVPKLQAGNIQTRLRGQNLQRQGPKYQHTDNGLMDMDTNQIVPGTESNKQVEITPELAAEFQNQDLAKTLIGKKASLREIQGFVKPDTAIATTAEGVNLINKADGSVIKRLGSPHEAPGPVVVTSNPENPNQQNVSTLNRKDNTLTPVNTPQGTPATKITPQASTELTKAESDYTNSQRALDTIRNLAKQGTSAADRDIVFQYFDAAAPQVGRRMNESALNNLVSVGTLPERAKVWFQKASSREIFTPDIRNEIINSLQTIVDGKKTALEGVRQRVGGKPATNANEPDFVMQNGKLAPNPARKK